ncbi:MAG: SRPBCC family protein [Actinomycetota bacterium]
MGIVNVVVGAGAASIAAGVAGTAFLVSRGRVHLDLGWGRSMHCLGPMDIAIDAPRDLVFQQVSGPYLGQTPASMKAKLKVLEQGENLVVAEHRTKLPLMDAVTVEAVRFERPGRITFRLLQGPVAHVWEEFLLEELGSQTKLSYRGEMEVDFWAVGSFYGASIVRPVWEATVAKSFEQIKRGAEQRAAARRRREPDGEA